MGPNIHQVRGTVASTQAVIIGSAAGKPAEDLRTLIQTCFFPFLVYKETPGEIY